MFLLYFLNKFWENLGGHKKLGGTVPECPCGYGQAWLTIRILWGFSLRLWKFGPYFVKFFSDNKNPFGPFKRHHVVFDVYRLVFIFFVAFASDRSIPGVAKLRLARRKPWLAVFWTSQKIIFLISIAKCRNSFVVIASVPCSITSASRSRNNYVTEA